VDRVRPDGTWESGVVTRLQNPLGVAFDSKGTMYVLQFASLFSPAQLKYLPHGGKVLRVERDGRLTPVVTDLTYPTFMKFDAQDTLWIVNFGNQSSKGEGQILKVRLGGGVVKGPRIIPPADTPTEEVLRAEARARENLQRMTVSRSKGVVIKIVETEDTTKWGYEPAVAKVRAGDPVTFVNTGKMPHTATSTRGMFDTGFINAGESKVITVGYSGEHEYLCTPHPWMKAKIVVEGGAAYVPAAAEKTVDEKPRLVSAVAIAALFVALIGLTLLVAFTMRKKG